jgi:CubicO group peptidase (beta-lactamase class C family)
MPNFIAWHGRNLTDHTNLRNQWYAQGYRFVSLSIYGATSSPVFAAVMVQQSATPDQHDFYNMTASQWQNTFDAQAALGFGPMILCATGTGDNPLFAAVFVAANPIPFTQHGLALADLQSANSNAKTQGQILQWAASYGTGNDVRFAGIWAANAANTLWNADGLQESAAQYQVRFDAETVAWCRPSFVTLNAGNQYLSVFVANEVGEYWARHGMTPGEYQSYFDTYTAQGFYPVLVQAAGADATSARFAALFNRSADIIARQFTATGPVAVASIDNAVQQIMTAYPAVRQAALAIVNGKKLVYARGYTTAEPDWPSTQPTTYFRLASVSKTITALAIFQLIDSGSLALTDTLQGVLNLSPPGGGSPADVNFSEITIQQLLEHTSGVDSGAWGGGAAVIAAYAAAGISKSLPITQDMLDAYIASLPLVSTPGSAQTYNNTGYYLLGRVVARKLMATSPIAAFRSQLFPPLNITRIRSCVDLLANQPSDEARYQATALNAADLGIAQSQQTPDQPWVQSGYGDYDLAVAQGCAGFSAAVTDLARLVAILIDQNDNPAMKRATITAMLTNAITTLTKWASSPNGPRAGYGLDVVSSNTDGSFYGQKGGLIVDAASVLQFNDQWGFVLVFDSAAQTSQSASWYPDFTAGLSVAKNVTWTKDLFPTYGMPAL